MKLYFVGHALMYLVVNEAAEEVDYLLHSGNMYILVVTEDLSGYVLFRSAKACMPNAVANEFVGWCSALGTPECRSMTTRNISRTWSDGRLIKLCTWNIGGIIVCNERHLDR